MASLTTLGMAGIVAGTAPIVAGALGGGGKQAALGGGGDGAQVDAAPPLLPVEMESKVEVAVSVPSSSAAAFLHGTGM